MRRIILALLVAYIVTSAPWRLIWLTGYVLTTSATLVHMPDTNIRYWETLDLEQRLIKLGWTITYKPPSQMDDGGLYGSTEFHTRQIDILDSLSWDGRFSVLAHEGGHTLQPGWANHGRGEAFAEAVAMLMTGDRTREHARYLARMRGDYLLMVITEWQSIYHAASVLEGV